MKIGIYADPHFSQTSSIIVGKQGEFTGRLDNLIKSFKWMNKFFKDNDCKIVFCLGDMTDKPVLTAEEITAMSRCGIEDHHLIVGNHCRSDQSGEMNSLSIFNKVYYKPRIVEIPSEVNPFPTKILILPYSSTPYDLTEFADKVDIILSHNDIKGYDYGSHVSTSGYDLHDIMERCTLFINGHLHNGGWLVKDRIMNLGQLSGMNFSSCGGEWEPSVGILDTDKVRIDIYENPEAYRFKKIEVRTLPQLKGYLSNLPQGHYVIQAKVPEKIVQSSRKVLDQCDMVVASRLLTIHEKKNSESPKKSQVKLDQASVYDKLRNFIKIQNPTKYDQTKLNEIINSIETKEGAD